MVSASGSRLVARLIDSQRSYSLTGSSLDVPTCTTFRALTTGLASAAAAVGLARPRLLARRGPSRDIRRSRLGGLGLSLLLLSTPRALTSTSIASGALAAAPGAAAGGAQAFARGEALGSRRISRPSAASPPRTREAQCAASSDGARSPPRSPPRSAPRSAPGSAPRPAAGSCHVDGCSVAICRWTFASTAAARHARHDAARRRFIH